MYFIDELTNLKLYRRKFYLPVNEKNKKKNSVVMLLGSDYESSKRMMNHPLLVNKYFNSYFVEQSVMYYITNESGLKVFKPGDTLITESIDELLKNDRSNVCKITYSGYDIDTEEVMGVITPEALLEMAANFKVKIPKTIKVNVYRTSTVPESTIDTINVSSKKTYDERLKNYTAYLRYNMMSMILNNVPNKIELPLKYAICLWESDMYKIHKSHWIFGNEFKSLCNAVDIYINNKGHKAFVKDVVMNPNGMNKLTTKTLPDLIVDDIKRFATMFGIHESMHPDDLYGKSKVINGIMMVNENTGISLPINEDAAYDMAIKKALYNDRYKTMKDLNIFYDKVKEENPEIKRTFKNLSLYKSLNLFYDLAHYMESYVKNSTYKMERGCNTMTELMNRLINDKRLPEAGYTIKTVLIPILDWDLDKEKPMWLYTKSINPISCLYNMMNKNSANLKTLFGDTTFVFLGAKGYFKMNFNEYNPKTDLPKFLKGIKLLRNVDYAPDDEEADTSSTKAITMDIVDKVEKSQGVEINNISVPKEDKESEEKDKKEEIKLKEKDKEELVKTVAKAAEVSKNEEDTLDALDNNDKLKEILASLSEDPDEKSNISAARASRIVKIENDLMDKEFKGKPIRDILEDNSVSAKKLPETSLNIASVNDEWKHLQFKNLNEVYDMDGNLVKMFTSFNKMSHPLSVIEINAEDTSTSEDAIETYTIRFEDENGKRFTVKLDIPLMIDNRYMKLRGNRKEIPHQLFLMPIIKTDDDTVQVVTNYNKIFIRRFGTTAGKSNVSCDKLMKTLNKHEYKSLQVIEGDCSKICARYELPIDYVDLASVYSKIITKDYTIYFNQDELREKYKDKIDEKLGLPYGYDNKSKQILYFNSIIKTEKETISYTFAYWLSLILSSDAKLAEEGFTKDFNSAPKSVRYTYSKASILNTEIPLIVVCAYTDGLTSVLKKAGIKYEFTDKKSIPDPNTKDFIRFSDGYLIYDIDYASSMLMNGLKACPTDQYSISEINSKPMYLDFLDTFGGRIKADGLDNFADLLIDYPITYNTLEYYKLPKTYIEVLLYANRLLVDNKFIKHTYITDNRRVRRNEQINAIAYSVMAHAYGYYCNQLKHGRSVPLTAKQSAVIDEVLLNPTTSDMSIINALSEYEGFNAVTSKGPCGMNSDRSYTLDKRSFDDSMMNVLALSTGFAGNVGVTRQLTIDSNVSTDQGYVVNKEENIDKLSVTKSLCMTEALTPFGTERDDPFRTAMTFIQTSKHGMKCRRANPSLVTNGADEALPYLISNIFAHKSKAKGKVIELNDERIIVEYEDGTHEYVDLTEHVEKNSSNGFFITLKLDTDLKLGQTVKAGDIIAYDKGSFSNEIGESGNIAYNIGTLSKLAILNTDEGYEDSAIISHKLSNAMTSDVVLCKDVSITKATNVYNLVKKGQKVEEGDTLMILQAPYDEEDTNVLLKNLVGDEEEITNIGRIPIKSKVTGVVQDIVITRCVDIDEMSPTLQKIVTSYEKDITRRKKEMEKYGLTKETVGLGSTDKLPPTGKLKNCADGLLIEIYLKYEDKMSVGDKLIYTSALKGVVRDIFPEGDEPTSEYRPNEKVDSLLAVGSVNGRMVCSIIANAGLGKAMVELSRHTKDILGIKYNDDIFND